MLLYNPDGIRSHPDQIADFDFSLAVALQHFRMFKRTTPMECVEMYKHVNDTAAGVSEQVQNLYRYDLLEKNNNKTGFSVE